MADVLCPHCGKPNPPEAESCIFCGEALVAPEETPDWLSGLRSGDWQENASSEPPNEEPLSDAEIPDWLSRVRSRNQEDQPESDLFASLSGETPEPTDDSMDWLQNLSGAPEQSQGNADDWLSGLSGSAPEEEQAEPKTPAAPETGGRSWFNRLQHDESDAVPPQPESIEPAEETPAGSPDESESWLSDLQGWDASLGESQPEQPGAAFEPDSSGVDESEPQGAPASTSELPDWFADLKPPTEESAVPEDRDAQPDWLSRATPGIPVDESAEETPSPASEGGEEANLPAWLSGFAATEESAPEASASDQLPDWLRSAPAGGASASEEPASTDLPAWMQAAGEEAQPAASAGEPEAAEGEPDFDFSAFASAGEDREAAPSPENEPAEASETPDFAALFGEEAEPASTAATPPDFSALFDEEQEPAAPEAQSPDFSALFDETQAPSQEAESLPDFSALSAEEPAAESEEPAPDERLSDLSALFAAGAAASAAEETPAETPDWLHTPADAQPEEQAEPAAPLGGDIPDWLSRFDEASPTGPADLESIGEINFDEATPFIDEQQPGWLNNIRPSDKDAETPSVSPLIEHTDSTPIEELQTPFLVELPEWLDQQSSGEMAQAGAPSGEETGEELAKADLPSWVEDLRPLEAVIPGEVHKDASETQIEKAGPLAGIRGVLQSEDVSTHYRKPPTYSARLRVSERQRAQAAILENLLALETSPKAVPSEPSRAPAMILRVVIALLLILSLLTMLLPNFRLVELPPVYPAGVTALYDRVEALPDNAAVLLAVDYEPGLSGEMRYAASAVIEHLMVKNARMLFVSTVPTGPVLADQLLGEVNLRRPEYALAERTVNLGYLPGGTTSLLEFAHSPRSAAPSALDTPLTGILAWDHPAAQGLNGLQDFALVIVLTDSPETGRAWIEQVQPVLSGAPLTMVTSAQAAPLLQPYYDSGQVQGMTAGMQGGAMYEQRAGRVGAANQFLGAYQSGAVAGILLLIFGGVISALLGVSRRKPTQKGKA